MTILTLGEAAKLTGRSKPTISKACKPVMGKDDKGKEIQKAPAKITAQKVDGVFQIETSELLRVFPAKSEVTAVQEASAQSDDLEKKYMTEKISDLESRLDDMKDERDQALKDGREDRARMLALLSDQRPKSFWQRLTGK